jgi:hypothetical protein
MFAQMIKMLCCACSPPKFTTSSGSVHGEAWGPVPAFNRLLDVGPVPQHLRWSLNCLMHNQAPQPLPAAESSQFEGGAIKQKPLALKGEGRIELDQTIHTFAIGERPLIFPMLGDGCSAVKFDCWLVCSELEGPGQEI